MGGNFNCVWTGKAVGVNRRLIPGKGRWVNDSGYRAFKADMALLFSLNCRKPITTDCKVFIGQTVNKARDIDSLVKPVLDALEQGGVIQNDRQVVQVMTTKAQKKRGEVDRLYVEVSAL